MTEENDQVKFLRQAILASCAPDLERRFLEAMRFLVAEHDSNKETTDD